MPDVTEGIRILDCYKIADSSVGEVESFKSCEIFRRTKWDDGMLGGTPPARGRVGLSGPRT